MIGKVIGVYGLTAFISYLLGSISFATIFTYLFTKKDIRTMGSGNAGATNVLRSVGALPAALTLIGDVGKGVAAVLIGSALFRHFDIQSISGEYAYEIGRGVAGLFALLGHLFPLYFNFKGGKGVLTAAGICLVMNPICLLVCLAAFLICLAISKIVSLSSCIACAMLPVSMFVYTYFFQYKTSTEPHINYVVIMTLLAFVYAAIVIFMHRSNIERLKNGTESKISVKKKEKQA